MHKCRKVGSKLSEQHEAARSCGPDSKKESRAQKVASISLRVEETMRAPPPEGACFHEPSRWVTDQSWQQAAQS